MKISKSLIRFAVLLLFISCEEEPLKKNLQTIVETKTLRNLPEPLTNNPVIEGFINDKPYIFTFGGLDSTAEYSGIHKRAYKFDVLKNKWHQIANVPDTLGKIASAASRIKDTIYIIGGYHVFNDHSEKSSNKVHRYNIINDRYLDDGSPIPVPIDDQVQAVWKDSLIYVITGWSDKENMPDVQIYNPVKNKWSTGTPIPNNHTYKSFGASGTIIGDTIYYFGGASMGKHYPIQNVLRKGIINKDNPTEIEWSQAVLDSTIVGYRMASITMNNKPMWIGGSETTYNYSPEAYNKSGGVEPSNRILSLESMKWKEDRSKKLPMDLRGIAKINDSTFILVGGMESGQKVSSKVYQLQWKKQ